MKKCRLCGFTVVDEPPSPEWVCSACPQGPLCPECDTPVAVDRSRGPYRTLCPGCRGKLSILADGRVELYDEFKEYLRRYAAKRNQTPLPRKFQTP